MDLNKRAAASVGVTVTGVRATGVTVTLRIYIPRSNLSRVINIPKVFLKFLIAPFRQMLGEYSDQATTTSY
jgi:hypothetical protein